jgi:enoyl-CoA hydratase/carnithine racemase
LKLTAGVSQYSAVMDGIADAFERPTKRARVAVYGTTEEGISRVAAADIQVASDLVEDEDELEDVAQEPTDEARASDLYLDTASTEIRKYPLRDSHFAYRLIGLFLILTSKKYAPFHSRTSTSTGVSFVANIFKAEVGNHMPTPIPYTRITMSSST